MLNDSNYWHEGHTPPLNMTFTTPNLLRGYIDGHQRDYVCLLLSFVGDLRLQSFTRT